MACVLQIKSDADMWLLSICCYVDETEKTVVNGNNPKYAPCQLCLLG